MCKRWHGRLPPTYTHINNQALFLLFSTFAKWDRAPFKDRRLVVWTHTPQGQIHRPYLRKKDINKSMTDVMFT